MSASLSSRTRAAIHPFASPLNATACAVALLLCAHDAQAQTVSAPAEASAASSVDTVQPSALPRVEVSGGSQKVLPSVAQTAGLPNTTESVSAAQAYELINVMTVEDMVKYLPDLLVRKRFNGDTQAPIATRTTGLNASARSLILADGISLTTLIGNNNSNASPRWFMVSPEEIERIEVMYGPFAAAYPGNSYGAAVVMQTRMPEQFEASVRASASTQAFDLYGTHDRFGSNNVSATVGSRAGAFSWWLSANRLEAQSQPITFATLSNSSTPASASLPVVSGAFADQNRTGGNIQVLGAGNFTHTEQESAKLKLAYDLDSRLRASYTLGWWSNDADTHAASYLSVNGSPYYGAASGSVNLGGFAYSASSIASGFSSSTTDQQHRMQALSLGTHGDADLQWQLVWTDYSYLKDQTRSSTGFSSSAPNLYPGAQQGGNGRIAVLDGTGWNTLDLSGSWKLPALQQTLSAGLHQDRYALYNPSYNTSNWLQGDAGSLYSNSAGKTQTRALWLQDAWQIQPSLLATLGARYERWQASDGLNQNSTGATASAPGTLFTVNQPAQQVSAVSPKATLAWTPNADWDLKASYGRALRFATVGELYQNIATGSTFTAPNPNLKPEDVDSAELALVRRFSKGALRVSLFNELNHNALISQSAQLGTAVTSYTVNVDRTRVQGIELVADREDLLIKGLDLSGTLTYADSRILANSTYVPTIAGATSVGRRVPYVPDWRASAVATYRPDAHWSITLAGRYSGKMYATVDNTDIHPGTYTGFQSFFVADLRAQYRWDAHWTASIGVDNLNNRAYWLYHPFPQRSLVADLRWQF